MSRSSHSSHQARRVALAFAAAALITAPAVATPAFAAETPANSASQSANEQVGRGSGIVLTTFHNNTEGSVDFTDSDGKWSRVHRFTTLDDQLEPGQAQTLELPDGPNSARVFSYTWGIFEKPTVKIADKQGHQLFKASVNDSFTSFTDPASNRLYRITEKNDGGWVTFNIVVI